MAERTRFDRRTVLRAAGGAALLPLASGLAGAETTQTVDDALETSGTDLQEVLVVFDSNADVDHLRHLDLVEGYHRFEALPIGYAVLTGDQVGEVASWSDVRHVDANHDLEWHNDEARDLTGVSTVHDQLFYTGETAHAVVVDTGVDGDHPDLESNLQHNYRWANPLEGEDPMWTDVGPVDTSEDGHGTHCSGSIAGDGTASDGEFAGMAPDADLTVYSCSAVLLQIVGAYDHFLDRHRRGVTTVNVVNNSYGLISGNDADYNPYGALEVATWEAFTSGVLPVFSAGNSGESCDATGSNCETAYNTYSNYAKGPHVLGSAATRDDLRVTAFSSRGRRPSYSAGEGSNYDRELAFENLVDLFDADYEAQPVVGEASFSGTVEPAAHDPVTGTKILGNSEFHEWTAPEDAGYVEGTLSWTPTGQDVDVYVHEGATDGPVVASGATLNEPEHFAGAIEPGETYYVEVRPFNTVTADYTVELTARAQRSDAPSGPYGVYRPSAGTPGHYVMSTLSPDDPLQGYAAGTGYEDTRPYYGRLSGTSMSGPVLVGICTLVYDAYNQEHGEFPDPIEVVKLVESTAHDTLEQYNPWNVGSGFADARRAVERAAAGDLATFDETELAVDGEATDRTFYAEGSRSDDGSAFTGGQTDQVDITIDEATEAATVRDRIPFDWSVVGGDATTVYTQGGNRYAEFDAAASAGDTLTYFAEAPDGTAETGDYEFGPAQARPAEGAGGFIDITGTDTNAVVGEET